jgi:hypothetical protein
VEEDGKEGVFKLSLLYNQTLHRRMVFPFSFFLFLFGRCQMLIARAMCEVNVTVAALCTSFAAVYRA